MPPTHSPSNSASSSSTPRHSRRSSKSLSTASDRESATRDAQQHSSTNPTHRRDKTKSGSNIQQQAPRPTGRESHQQSLSQERNAPVSQAPSIPLPQRPAIKSRAQSAPLVPNIITTRGPVGQNGNLTGSEGSGVIDDEIAHDPFFQRYNSQHETQDGELSMSPNLALDEIDGHHSPLSRGTTRNGAAFGVDTSGSHSNPLSPTYWPGGKQQNSQPLQEINVAVLGAPKVGKSTFIQQAFDLAQMPLVSFTRRKMSLDGTIYIVRLIELGYNDLDMDDDQCICWPDTIEEQPVPAIDGAFTLYDVTNRDSLMQMPETLSGIYHAGMPYLLVACKCDYSPNLRPIDTSRVDAPLQSIIGDVRTFQTSETSPDTQKRCMAVMLRQIIAKRNQQLNVGATRRRANSTAVQHTTTIPSTLQKHHRSNSEISMYMYRGQRQRYKRDMNVPLSARSQSHQHLSLASPSQTLFEIDAPPNESTTEDDVEDNADQGISMKAAKPGNLDLGYSFGELVDRLLIYPPSKTDQRFTSMFLALYRLFASPSQLLDNIIEKSKAVSLDNIPTLSMVQQRQHHLNILEKWIGNYPGDFAHSITKLKLQTFINELGEMPIFAVAANQLAANLEFVTNDDDTDWAFCDRDGSASENDSLRIVTNGLMGHSASGELSTPISPIGNVSPTMSSTQSLLSLVEQATRQAAYLVPNGRFPLTKLQWHLIMDQPEEAIARELTRMDWTMFCSIRPRDLVRHVSLPESQRAKCRSLENVERMIDHFNHVACWVSNFILLRDKPKHRSFMLEKMMKIARELRKMNNYSSLGAFIAGINNSSIIRLSATRDLIDPAIGKDFLKLEILMSSQRSHASYRLAWENTRGERIPYFPLHRRDLVAAAEGNKTFIDELDARDGVTKGRRINWKKFEIMGDVVIEIQKARDVAYPTLVRSDEIKSLVVDMEIERDEDKLYERSQQVEPSGATGGKPRRFPWLQS